METRSGLRTGAAWLILAGSCLGAGCVEAGPDAQSAPSATAAAPASVAASDRSPATAQIPPGAYATESGWGQLSIAQAPDGSATFALETESAGDGCSFAGQLQAYRATVYSGGSPAQCVFDLATTAEGIRIGTATADACDAYCGRNGSYEGDYRRLAPACVPSAIAQARERFKALYDREAHAEADEALAPVYRQCLGTLPMIDEGGVRNDYALNRHKLKDDAGCLAALEKYRGDAARSDDEIAEGMAPAVAEDYLAVIGAARTNQALCSRGK